MYWTLVIPISRARANNPTGADALNTNSIEQSASSTQNGLFICGRDLQTTPCGIHGSVVEGSRTATVLTSSCRANPGATAVRAEIIAQRRLKALVTLSARAVPKTSSDILWLNAQSPDRLIRGEPPLAAQFEHLLPKAYIYRLYAPYVDLPGCWLTTCRPPHGLVRQRTKLHADDQSVPPGTLYVVSAGKLDPIYGTTGPLSRGVTSTRRIRPQGDHIRHQNGPASTKAQRPLTGRYCASL